MQKKNRFLAMLLTSTLAAGMIAGSFGVEVSAAETSELTKSVYTQTADEGVISDADINVTEKTVGNKSFKIEETLSSKKVTAQKPKQDIFAAYPDADLKAKKSKQLNKETVEEGDFVYVVNDDGTLMVSSYSGYNSIVNIPEQVNGREVTSIENGAFYGDDTIKEINIPKTIKGVEISWEREYYTDEEDTEWYYDCCGSKNDTGNRYNEFINDPYNANAFYGCKNLKEVTLPKEVTYIHEGEFSDNKVTLYVSKDSYAHKYAVDHELKYEVIHIPGDVDITVYGESQAVFTVEHQEFCLIFTMTQVN